MHFFLDENSPLAVKRMLEDRGHTVTHALEYFSEGTNDDILFQYAQHNEAIFLITDKGFFHTIPFLTQNRSAAVVVITLNQPNRTNILSRFKSLLHSVKLESNPQNVYLITDKRIIVRN